MKKKQILIKSIILVLSVVLFLAACSSGNQNGGSEDEVYTIRFAHILDEETPLHQAALELKKDVEEKSDERLEIELYPNGQLFDSERETIEAIQANNVEMSEIAAPVVANFVPEFSVFNLPFLFDDRESARKAVDGELGDQLNDMLEEEDLVGLGYGENGFRNIFNTKGPIESPEDLKGLKLRVIENKMYEDIFQTLGANASPMGFGETYSALQQGVYDGLDIELTVASDSKLEEVTDYLTISEHAYTATVNLVNKDFFDNLPEDLQEILVEATDDYSELERELTVEQEDDALENLSNELSVNELDQEQKDEFEEKLQPIYDKYEDTIGKDLIETAQEAND